MGLNRSLIKVSDRGWTMDRGRKHRRLVSIIDKYQLAVRPDGQLIDTNFRTKLWDSHSLYVPAPTGPSPHYTTHDVTFSSMSPLRPVESVNQSAEDATIDVASESTNAQISDTILTGKRLAVVFGAM